MEKGSKKINAFLFAANIKGIHLQVSGGSDIFLTPDLEAGNMLVNAGLAWWAWWD
jgi:phosphotransacetylase